MIAIVTNASGIYAIKSKLDNRVYIGQSKTVRKRLLRHRNYLVKKCHVNNKLQGFCNKYGIENLDFIVIEYCSEFILNEREKYWVRCFDSFNKGFNKTNGGEDSPMSIEENRNKAFKTMVTNGRIKRIYAYSIKTGEMVYECDGSKEMEKLSGAPQTGVVGCVLGNLKTSKGFHFSYQLKTQEQVLSDIKYELYTEQYKEKASNRMKGKNNPMYGRLRLDVRKLKISKEEIVSLFLKQKPVKDIAKSAGCCTVYINGILRAAGIYQGSGAHLKRKTKNAA